MVTGWLMKDKFIMFVEQRAGGTYRAKTGGTYLEKASLWYRSFVGLAEGACAHSCSSLPPGSERKRSW